MPHDALPAVALLGAAAATALAVGLSRVPSRTPPG
jgi:hypothetical protein